MSRKFTQAEMAAYMTYLRRHNPKGYEALHKEYDKSLIEAEEKVRRYKEELKRLDEAGERRKRMPIPTNLPNLNTNVFGMVAFRVWRYHSSSSRLGSSFVNYEWGIVNISDEEPTEKNSFGLHCVKLTALSLLSGMRSYFQLGKDEVCGLVELRGTVQEHSDGILRAEWARILYLFITSDNKDVEGTYLGLYNNYPGTPIYILNPEQLALLLVGETLKQKMKGDF